MDFFGKIYSLLPASMQNLACSLHGLLINRKRFDAQFYKALRDAEERTFISEEELKVYVSQRLANFCERVAVINPHCKALFKEHGVLGSGGFDFISFSKLPIINKAIAKKLFSNQSQDSLGQRTLVAHTSGTTGSGLIFPVTESADHEKWAVWWRYRRWHNVNLNTWSGHFGGRSVVPATTRIKPFWRYNYPGRQVLFSAYHLSKATAKDYFDVINERSLPWLHGYPSFLSLLASYIIELGLVFDHQIKWVTTGAENLLAHQAEQIEKAFGVRPIQHYGMAEGVANISQCPEGSLHVDEDYSFVEFIPTQQTCKYRIVGTNFSNVAYPLLRYDTGDVATITGKKCSCGRPGRVVDYVDGRQEDYIILKDGSKIGRIDHAFKDLIAIKEAQIVQEFKGHIFVKIVKNTGFGENDEKRLIAELKSRLRDTEIQIIYVDEIEKTASGKLRLVVSKIIDCL